MNALWLRRWCRLNPLAALALGAMVGVITADLATLQPSIWLGTAVAATALGAAWLRRIWACVLAAGFLFALLHAQRLAETSTHPLRALLQEDQRVLVEARLFPWLDGVELDAARAGAELVSLRWQDGRARQHVSARLRVNLPKGFVLDQPGLYELSGLIYLPRPPTNPGQFDGASYSLRMGWVATLRADRVRLIHAEPVSPRYHFLHWAEASRQWISAALSQGIETQEPAKSVVLAMALGASSAAGDEVEESFRDSGTLHVFAVSGLHVVMVALVFHLLLRLLGVRGAAATSLLILLVFAYAYVTGWRPSAARAALMITITLAAPLLHRQAAVQNSLGAAALLLLALDSHQFFLPGFQLSFAVLWAIAIGAEWLMGFCRRWTEHDPFVPQVLLRHEQRLAQSGRRFVASLMCVSVVAWLGSLPLMIAHFNTITPVALLANCILVPLSSLCIGCSCLSLVFAGFGLRAVQWTLNQTCALLAHAMVISAGWFATLPMANVNLVPLLHTKPPPAEMRIFHITGGGAANHLSAGESHWLLDCGDTEAWRYVLRPYLREAGIRRLDGLFLSHGDAGHAGAASEALEELRPLWVRSSRHEPWRYDPPFSSMRRLSQITAPDSPRWRRSFADEQILLGDHRPVAFAVRVLYPTPDDAFEKADDRCLVLMITTGPWRVLWLGDAGFITEKRLLERRADVRCHVLIRNQHKADASGLSELLLAAQPRAVVSSNDAFLTEEVLPERVRAFCAESGAELYDLGECGSVAIRFEEAMLTLEAFRSRKRTLITPPLAAGPPGDS